MNKLKIALAQIDYRPAFILESHELLVEPIFTSIKEPHTSISLLSFNGSEKVSANLREKYISWLRIKVIAIIKKCIDLSVDLVVFPEYSIPVQLLSDVCSLTKDKKLRVIAGTHIVTKVTQCLPDGYPDLKNYLRCAMSPIIANGKIENFTCKKILAAEEHNNIRIPKDDVSDIFELNNYNLNVKICIEAIADQEALQACEKAILAVPSLSRNIEPFKALQILAKYKEIPIIYVNGACYGGSVISGPYALEGKHWFVENNASKPVPKNCEALVTATINLDAIRRSVGTVLLPSAIKLNEVLPFLYKENEADNKLIQLIDQCKKDQDITPLCEVVIANSSILREIIKKLQLDEKQGILDCETLTENLNYLKINSFNFLQMTLKQVEEAVSMLAKRTELGFTDNYYGVTQEQLFAFLNKHKKSLGVKSLEFSNDKGLFRGRDLEKNALSRFFDNPKQKMVCINGLRGIGKTKLVNSIENEILPFDSAWRIKQIRFTIGVGYDYIISKLSYDLNLTYIETTGKSASDIATQFAKQIKKYSPITIILDDFHYCLNNNGYFTDLRIKDFFITLIRDIQVDEDIKIVLTSNRRIREPLQEALNNIEVSKLDKDTIESIISYCYKKITRSTSAPKIEENVVNSAYGN
jgi:predicted amidohydrolase